ncbi:MAG: insulinase family protein [Rhodothermales bacterium]|nr:insulinase family protein [Rhodothermales bacterium]
MTLSDRIIETQVGDCRLFMLRTTVDSVVSFYGSFATRPDLTTNQDILQDLAVALLDKGTTERDKFQIAEELESRGAEIRFHSMATRIAFSGKCLNRDVTPVIGICAEQLRKPSLSEDEYNKVLPRLQASVMQSMESTGAQSGSALRRLIFDKNHPNFAHAPEAEMEMLSDTKLADIAGYYRSRAGANEFVLVVVGDFEADDVTKAVSTGFGEWPDQNVSRKYDRSPVEKSGSPVHIPMRDKQNLDVRIGHAVDVIRTHRDYLPLYLGIFILGGNFSSRLMDTIRDKEGLTYGIYAQLNGVSSEFCGYFLVRATFSADTLDVGIRRTNELIAEFAENGISPEELASKKKTVSGSYKVGLASTGSLARTIGTNIISGLGAEYVDLFASLVEGVSVEEVNAALSKWIDPDKLLTATAGTLGT